ncbi:hypothetical protein BRD17_04920 [Halobacteriales archaeon SW_7_68_16]|nr:MAG: hypothetical protein BRD17_04920 [Halobacteriales archaeon SW_7_68_16]
MPLVAGLLVAVDARRTGYLAGRFGPTAPRVAAVTVVAVAVAGSGPDLVTNGVNVLYPLHDQFYVVDGHLHWSSTRGIVQTFVERPERGSTRNVQYSTPVDPAPADPGADRDVERIVPLVGSGLQLLVIVVAVSIPPGRSWGRASPFFPEFT